MSALWTENLHLYLRACWGYAEGPLYAVLSRGVVGLDFNSPRGMSDI